MRNPAAISSTRPAHSSEFASTAAFTASTDVAAASCDPSALRSSSASSSRSCARRFPSGRFVLPPAITAAAYAARLSRVSWSISARFAATASASAVCSPITRTAVATSSLGSECGCSPAPRRPGLRARCAGRGTDCAARSRSRQVSQLPPRRRRFGRSCRGLRDRERARTRRTALPEPCARELVALRWTRYRSSTVTSLTVADASRSRAPGRAARRSASSWSM